MSDCRLIAGLEFTGVVPVEQTARQGDRRPVTCRSLRGRIKTKLGLMLQQWRRVN